MSSINNLFRRNTSVTAFEKNDNMRDDGMVHTLDEATQDQLERDLLQSIGAVLTLNYPKPKGLPFWWAVEVHGSVIYILNLALSGQYGMVIHTLKCSDDKVIRFAGELLERFGVPRDTRKISAEKIAELHYNCKMRLRPEL